MEPNYLKIKEITFEIACRGIKPLSTNQDARRMQLRAFLKREKLSKPIALIQPFDWDKNISEITESIKDLEFSLTEKDIRSAHIQSRLMHLDNRLTLLNPSVENEDQTSLKEDLYGQFLVLEGMLDETMKLRELSSAPLSVPLKITSTFSDLPSHINTVTTQAPIMLKAAGTHAKAYSVDVRCRVHRGMLTRRCRRDNVLGIAHPEKWFLTWTPGQICNGKHDRSFFGVDP
ncbi:hypothetical protein FQA39_LY17942 [Lamprigera yunnana]|nr:hypothetical protein FQA39_LY17942 [Lamprigera yunnana]